MLKCQFGNRRIEDPLGLGRLFSDGQQGDQEFTVQFGETLAPLNGFGFANAQLLDNSRLGHRDFDGSVRFGETLHLFTLRLARERGYKYGAAYRGTHNCVVRATPA